ncbi:multi antimicrobial extrusion protein (Na(+)/drug antiporter), MATE family of MDR efflux pumps [Lachnospiraceae bacterium KM106-2]|nr:multi antimicrobial extrusion protein (Na(+)/drug antiporter), MATE family of MDR efflux pumps [Lachnospiraceae bacterium KM106-2]
MFVGKINPDALTAVGITMPVQILQMAFVLLVGIGTSSLISIKLGEGKKEEAEHILYMALKYILIFLSVFAVLFLVFLDPVMRLLAISDSVMPYAKIYIVIIIVGSIIGIPGYCLNNSLRSIGQAKTSMKIIMITSILNIILDPILIYGFHLGIAGAAIATVISQTTLTVYVIWAFCKRSDFMIHLTRRIGEKEGALLRECMRMGLPSFYVQILAAVVNMFINRSLLKYGTDLDIAAVTIMSSIFSFYHMVVFGIVQGNNTICGFNWGAKKYERVRQSLLLAISAAFVLSTGLFLVIELFPGLLVGLFTSETNLVSITAKEMRIYLSMLPLVGVQTISAQYFQAVGKPKRSSVLAFLRYGVIVIPAILLLAPLQGVQAIYMSNAISDGVASLVTIVCISLELKQLKQML